MNRQNQSLPLGVIFDVDGVLVDSETIINHCSCQMFAELGIKANPEDFAQFVGTGEDQFILGVAQKYGFQIDIPAAKNRTYDLYLKNIKGRLKPLPDAFDFIALCRRLNKKIALATSADLRKLNGNLAEINLPPPNNASSAKTPSSASPPPTPPAAAASPSPPPSPPGN